MLKSINGLCAKDKHDQEKKDVNSLEVVSCGLLPSRPCEGKDY